MKHSTLRLISKRSQKFPLVKISYLVFLGAIAMPAENATAQIIPDATLGNESSIITPNVDNNIDQIEGGAIRGTTLFHSFQQFNIEPGRSVYFTNPTQIQNILSRVTGNNPSHVFGTLGVLGNANLILINPNGILFGPNARLNLRGSFVASTASSIQLSDGSFFSATNPQTAPLLSINVPIGLQFNQTPRSIINQSIATDSSGKIVGLEVPANQTLALVAGNIELEGGRITAAGGRVELGSIQRESFVSLKLLPNLALGYESVEHFGNIQLSQEAKIDTSGTASGEIQIWGGRVTLRDGAQIENSTLGEQNAGNLSVNASESLELVGMRSPINNNFSQNSGGLIAEAQQETTGNGGNITVNTRKLTLLDGAQISATTLGFGKAGNVSINASESVTAIGGGYEQENFFPSGIFARAGDTNQTEIKETGAGGSLTIQTQKLSLQQGAQISVSTITKGQAGDFTVIANTVELVGETFDGNNGSGLFAQALTGAQGKGGNLNIQTSQLLVKDGGEIAVGARTNTTQPGGSLTIKATESVQIIGIGANSSVPSRLLGRSQGAGGAGDLRIETPKLVVRDRAEITVSGTGTGAAGNLSISANLIQLNNQGKLTATSAAGDRGNITLNTSSLQLRHQSLISTNAKGTASGGNIAINSQTLAALENSDITADAEQSFGGRIQIQTQAIFGTAFRQQESPKTSDITASSELGAEFSGTVDIQIAEINPSQGLIQLSDNFINNTELITKRCSPGANNTFTITGRGGLPPSPSDPFSGDNVWLDLRDTYTNPNQSVEVTPHVSASAPDSLIEAQGWFKSANGDIILTARQVNLTNSHWWTLPDCQAQ
ncbi:filamentous hemagglutinin N-terminal domain-containing protein [Aerosakkonemataceae cyanobacterium BLCC-F154]|uniref:Filamentous hemagglutinin N-terminal domain-containing protein n=1 Tax=Floridaenema fluviatile BLCC-F154 TaxID=3153640 RepID=A0ABV4YCQ9_9CYAN